MKLKCKPATISYGYVEMYKTLWKENKCYALLTDSLGLVSQLVLIGIWK